MSKAQSPYDSLRHIPQYYDNTDSHNSALNLILALRPEWQESKGTIELVRFTDGITNTVCDLLPLSLVDPCLALDSS
jgi:ethanolamine kinase